MNDLGVILGNARTWTMAGNGVILVLGASFLAAMAIQVQLNDKTREFAYYFGMLVASFTLRVGWWAMTGWLGVDCSAELVRPVGGLANIMCDLRHIMTLVTAAGVGCGIMGIYHVIFNPIKIQVRYAILIAVFIGSFLISAQ